MKIHEIQPLILASQSPRRLDILEKHGITPVVRPTDTDETLPEQIAPEDAVMLLATEKAQACAANLDPAAFPSGLIVAADTIVYKDEIMGKPVDHDDAFRMLSKIRATFHYVMTGVSIIDIASGKEHHFYENTTVWCKDYSDQDIDDYIEQAQPYDKAGSYAIQGSFGVHIDHFDGDYENVVGLPYERLEAEVENFL